MEKRERFNQILLQKFAKTRKNCIFRIKQKVAQPDNRNGILWLQGHCFAI